VNLPRTADIVIIGGGVMGASAAYHLAQRGVRNVVLLEREEFFGTGATGRCAGGVRYQFSTEINVRLSMASLPMIDRFKEEIGQEVSYRKCGYLLVATRENDVAAFRRNVELQNRLGAPTELLSGDDVRARVPSMVFADALAGTFNRHDGVADPNSVVMGYVGAARRLGAKVVSRAEVTEVRVGGNKVEAVETTLGSIETHLVLNAAGPWASEIGRLAGVDVPIVPIRRQMFTTTPIPAVPDDLPFVIDFAQSLYFHREGAGLLVGMSNTRQAPGYDQRVDEAFELTTMEAAVARLPSMREAGRVSHWAGLYEVTPDAHPIFGTTPVDGFYIVGGFSGHGFMHGPVAGKLMAELIVDGSFATVDVSALDLARFDEGRLVHEYNVV